MTDTSRLLSDQVFQLNTLLWTVRDLPADGPVDPVLRRAGYYLAAIGRSVIVPSVPTVLDVLARLNGSEDRSSCHPDLWLKHASDPVQPVVELKSHGFAPSSSNSRQARKLMVSAFDLSDSLAEPGPCPGHVVYATEASDSEELATTLDHLATEFTAESVQTAPTAVLGFVEDDQGIRLTSPVAMDLPVPAAEVLSQSPVILRRDGMNDLQTLYFIPWIPGNEDSQDPELQSEGLRELTARLFTQTLHEVGTAHPPAELVLSCSHLLSAATHGVFDHWRDTDRKQFSYTAAKILTKTLKSINGVRRVTGDTLTIDMPDNETQDSIINRLRHADPGDPGSNLEAAMDEPATLF